MKKYTLITGASKGIGLELSKLFAKDKHNLILVARSKDLLEKIKDEFIETYHIDVIIYDLDLTVDNAAKILYEKTKSDNLVVEHLINNAGFGDYGPFIDSSLEKNHDMMILNMVTLSELTYFYLQDMVAEDYGKILNIASIAGFIPGPLMATYYATKAYVLSFSEALNKELKGTNVKVLTLCPGTTKTNFFNVASVDKSNLTKNLKPVSAESLAKYGYKKFLKNKVVAVHGFKNKLMVFGLRFAPRSLVRSVAYKIQSKRKD